jgi:hypothetical protein
MPIIDIQTNIDYGQVADDITKRAESRDLLTGVQIRESAPSRHPFPNP